MKVRISYKETDSVLLHKQLVMAGFISSIA